MPDVVFSQSPRSRVFLCHGGREPSQCIDNFFTSSGLTWTGCFLESTYAFSITSKAISQDVFRARNRSLHGFKPFTQQTTKNTDAAYIFNSIWRGWTRKSASGKTLVAMNVTIRIIILLLPVTCQVGCPCGLHIKWSRSIPSNKLHLFTTRTDSLPRDPYANHSEKIQHGFRGVSKFLWSVL